MYYELEINGDLYKGEVFNEEELTGPAIYYKKNKVMIIGLIEQGTFNSPCLQIDISEKTVYYGQLINS